MAYGPHFMVHVVDQVDPKFQGMWASILALSSRCPNATGM